MSSNSQWPMRSAAVAHAVPMPVMIRTRRYDDAFIAEMQDSDDRPKNANEAMAELYGV